ncbi:class I SAM-dependent methyltransferase [bacterium]|nr:MAG: class I SAM-dependent methyltransferase [bacterium]
MVFTRVKRHRGFLGQEKFRSRWHSDLLDRVSLSMTRLGFIRKQVIKTTEEENRLTNSERGYISRGRSLAECNAKFGKRVIENTLTDALTSHESVRLLEIGSGEGRVMMELRKLFPSIEIHGINKKPWPAMMEQNSLIATGMNYRIFSKEEARSVELPIPHFYDATQLKFPDNYFDVVISQVSIYQVKRKDLLLQEVWRVLKNGARAFLHMDSMCEGYPDFLNHETPRFLIYKNNKLYPFKRFIKELRDKNYNITCSVAFGKQRDDANLKRTSIVMYKNTDVELNLDLTFDELSSFDISSLGKIFNGDKIVGYRSVYQLKYV